MPYVGQRWRRLGERRVIELVQEWAPGSWQYIVVEHADPGMIGARRTIGASTLADSRWSAEETCDPAPAAMLRGLIYSHLPDAASEAVDAVVAGAVSLSLIRERVPS